MKKFVAVLLTLFLLISLCVPAALADNLAEPDENYSSRDARLFVDSCKQPVLRSGEIVDFPIVVDNRTGYTACNTRISLKGTGDYVDQFSFWGDSRWFEAKTIAGLTTVTPQIWVSSDLPDGRYDLEVSFQYDDGTTLFQSTDIITVTVYGKSESTPYVRNAKFVSEEIGKENESKLDVFIVNPMSDPVWDVKVSFNANASQGFSLYENFRPVQLPIIEANKVGKATFSVYVTQDTGNYPVTFDISYADVNNHIQTVTETIWVKVNRSAGAGSDQASRPRIIIQNYKTDVETVEAGKEFTMEFTLQNTSIDESVSNVKVVLGSISAGTSGSLTSGSGDVFFPSAGSNSFFIDKIGPKGTSTHSIKLMTSQSVEPGVYPVNLDISYDSDSSTNLTSEEQISFPVTQQQRLEIQNFQYMSDAMEGDMIPVSGQYINMGKSTIYNFSIGVEGDFTMMEGYGGYVGNLTSGYNDYLDLMIMPVQSGLCTGAIVFAYEDSQGNPKSLQQELSVNVQPMDMSFGDDMMGGMGDMTIDPETGNLVDASGQMYDPMTMEPIASGLPVWLIVLLVVLAAGVVAGGTFLIIVKKRKTKKDLVEDEED